MVALIWADFSTSPIYQSTLLTHSVRPFQLSASHPTVGKSKYPAWILSLSFFMISHMSQLPTEWPIKLSFGGSSPVSLAHALRWLLRALASSTLVSSCCNRSRGSVGALNPGV